MATWLIGTALLSTGLYFALAAGALVLLVLGLLITLNRTPFAGRDEALATYPAA